jgi:LysM repeat protein
MEAGRRSPLRILAPVALIAFGLALVLVLTNSNNSGNKSGGGATAAEKARDLGPSAAQKARTKRKKSQARSQGKLPQNVYIVKSGDTLGGIAERTGVPVEKLLSLNPGLDQFSLRSGQRIQLR